MTVYVCKNRYCRNKGKEFSAMNIDDVKVATGRRVHCDGCGQVAWFVRKVAEVSQTKEVSKSE